MQNFDKDEKLLHFSACDLILQGGRTIKGKLFVFKKRITFCSTLVHCRYLQLKPDPKNYILQIKMNWIENVQVNCKSLHIKTINNTLLIFQNLQIKPEDLFQTIKSNHLEQINRGIESVSEIQSNVNDLSEKDISFGWPSYRKFMEPLLQKLLLVKKDHKYGVPCTVVLYDVSISDVFDMIYTDKPYKPSQHMKLGKNNLLDNFQNPLHYLLEVLVGDKNLRATLWSPSIPQYLQTGKKDQIPQDPICELNQLPTRTIIIDHPTKLPFFGIVCPQVTMSQKLLLVDEKEFWIFVTTEISGMVYSENFKMKGYYKIVQIREREFLVETREHVEWKRKLLIVSNQIDSASAKENERMFNAFVLPFIKERNQEVIQLRKEECKEQEISIIYSVIQQQPIQQEFQQSIQQITQPSNEAELNELRQIKDEISELRQSLKQVEIKINQGTNFLKSLLKAQIFLIILILLMKFF